MANPNSAWGDNETQFFYSLTPDRILDAVESTGRKCTGRVLALNSMENRVYDIELLTDEDPNKRPPSIIAKFYRPGRWSEAQIRDEHEFLFELEEYDIPVVPPLRSEDGLSLWTMPEGGIRYALFEKARGRSPEEFTDEQLMRMGRLIARMHNVGATKKAEHRVTLNVDTYGWNNREYLLSSPLLPADVRPQYERVTRELLDTITPLFASVKLQRIHGDCHLGNILWGEHGPFLVDFDDMVSGPCVQDLWLFLRGRYAEAKSDFHLLLEGYEAMRAFDRSELQLIEPLRALRFIHFSAWIAKRWEDPAFPRSFPQFGGARYWQEQIIDLQEQLGLIREPSE